jgi:hypothetical protein
MVTTPPPASVHYVTATVWRSRSKALVSAATGLFASTVKPFALSGIFSVTVRSFNG